MNLKEIVSAWMISFNPSREQVTLALKRGKICENCVHLSSIVGIPKCGKCGCPISKKIFSNYYNTCPEKLWEECDSTHHDILKKL